MRAACSSCPLNSCCSQTTKRREDAAAEQLQAIREMQAVSSALRAEGKLDEAETLDREASLLSQGQPAKPTTKASGPGGLDGLAASMISQLQPQPQGFEEESNRFMRRQGKAARRRKKKGSK